MSMLSVAVVSVAQIDLHIEIHRFGFGPRCAFSRTTANKKQAIDMSVYRIKLQSYNVIEQPIYFSLHHVHRWFYFQSVVFAAILFQVLNAYETRTTHAADFKMFVWAISRIQFQSTQTLAHRCTKILFEKCRRCSRISCSMTFFFAFFLFEWMNKRRFHL